MTPPLCSVLLLVMYYSSVRIPCDAAGTDILVFLFRFPSFLVLRLLVLKSAGCFRNVEK